MAQIYVDDIIFRATSSNLDLTFIEEMKTKFEMRMVDGLYLFLGQQIRQLKDEILL